MLPKKPLGPPYSPHALTQCESCDSTIGGLGGGDRIFTNKVAAISTTQLEAPNDTMKLHHNGLWLRGDLNRLGCSNTQE